MRLLIKKQKQSSDFPIFIKPMPQALMESVNWIPSKALKLLLKDPFYHDGERKGHLGNNDRRL